MKSITLYHGTDTESAAQILSEGLKEGSYLTSLQELAEYYAECAMEEVDGDDYIILEMAIPTQILKSDTNAFDEPISISYKKICTHESDWHEMIENGKIPYPNDDDWKTSLEFVHSVKTCEPFNGTISEATNY